MKTFSDVFAAFGNRRIVADILGKPLATIHTWANRNTLPGDMDVLLVEAADARDIELTYEDLARIRAQKSVA